MRDSVRGPALRGLEARPAGGASARAVVQGRLGSGLGGLARQGRAQDRGPRGRAYTVHGIYK
eukprot:4386841-Heterocapsa_arctica.AAC.1